jgi:hypothetical protein
MSVRSVSRGRGLVSVALMAAFVGGCTGSPPGKPGSGSAGSGGGNTGTAGSTGSAGKGGAGTAGTGGSTGTAGNGAGATAGSGATGTAGAQGNGGTGAGGSSACASPETSFGFIGQGDSNQNFLSGVGALGPNVMYIFSSYAAPVGDGGTGSGGDEEVYVQAFDPKSGASKGPAQSLFALTLGVTQRVPTDTSQFLLTAAAVAPTGDIVLLYYLDGVGGGAYGLYAAFLSPAPAGGGADGGSVDGLKLQRVVLVSDNSVRDDGPGVDGVAGTPQVIWSNASQTFIVNWQHGGGGNHMAMNKYSVSGQMAGGLDPIPTLTNSLGSSEGSVGESGDLLGVAYFDGLTAAGATVGLTILDESENLVGTPIAVASADRGIPWTSVAGTAQGFVCFFEESGQQAVGEVFVSTSPNAGIVDAGASADAGIATLPGFKFTGSFLDARTISDNVGIGGKGGVGVALSSGSKVVSFAYVRADGVGHQGPYQVFAQGGGAGAMSMTNFNGSFAISTYSPSLHSTQVVATGICP